MAFKYPDSQELVDVPPRDRTRVVVGRKKRKAFLQALRRTGNVLKASHAAGYSDSTQLRRMRARDEDFAAAWDEALMAGTDVLLNEAHRRSMDGVLEPIVHKGQVVSFKVKYDTPLLMMLIRAYRPEFRDKTTVQNEHSGTIGVALLPMTAPSLPDWQQKALEVRRTQELTPVPGVEDLYEVAPEPHKPGDPVKLAVG